MTRRTDGLWQQQMTVIENGRKKQKFFYGKTKQEVLHKIKEYQEKQENGLSIEDAADEWLEWKSATVSFKTAEGYKPAIKRIKNFFAGFYIKNITPALVQSFIDSIAAQGYKRTTIQRPLDVLRMIYDYFIVHPNSNIKYNPCSSVRLPAGLKQESRDLASREDIEIVKRSVNLSFGLFAYFIMFSGLRDGEALAIRREDITEDHIIVNKSVSWQTNKPVIKSPKTKYGNRKVNLLDPLKNALPQTWKGYLFSADGGKSPLTNTEFRARWNGYCRAAGLADSRIETHINPNNKHTYNKTIWTNRIVPYQLRHEFATMCFDAGLDPYDVKVLMGHSDESTARKIYTHVLESRRAKSANKLNEYVKKM